MSYLSVFLTALMLINISETNREKRFIQPAEEEPLVSFGVIADVQYCDCEPAGTRHYRQSLEKLLEAMNVFRMLKPEFVINLGDLIDRDYSSYEAVNEIIKGSDLNIYHVTGNHDYAVEPRLIKRLPQLKEHKSGYYSFALNNFKFICLNGNEISKYTATSKRQEAEALMLIEELNEKGEINGHDWNGGMSKTQLEWFDKQLTDSESAGEKAIVFCHFPVNPANEHNLLNYRSVLEILGRHKNVVAWFNGHNHAGNYGNVNMTHFITLKGMVETESTGSFAIVEVYRNKIWIRGYGREKSQILAY